MMMTNHFFHLVNYSPWPIIMAMSLINLGSSVIIMIMYKESLIMILSIMLILVIKFQWWRDIISESLYEGRHSMMVKSGISMGVVSFIISELCFFISFFWMYFYLSLSPDINMGMVWPPLNIKSVNFLDIPLLNTLILLTSGFFITWSHYAFMLNKNVTFKMTYYSSVMLGIYFFMIQMYEYHELSFDLSDSVFGSSFFILTGFHGFHVIVGIVFISINLKRFINNNFSSISMKGFEYSAWYWHFVDVVWLFLYLFIYWWSM